MAVNRVNRAWRPKKEIILLLSPRVERRTAEDAQGTGRKDAAIAKRKTLLAGTLLGSTDTHYVGGSSPPEAEAHRAPARPRTPKKIGGLTRRRLTDTRAAPQAVSPVAAQ